MFSKLTPLPLGNDVGKRIIWLKENQHLCAKPFHTVQFSGAWNGDFQVGPCCNYVKNITSIPKNGNLFEDLKSDILAGMASKHCARCFAHEKSNDYSERVRDMADWSQDMVESFLSKAQSNNFNLGVKFSNFCNLACRSCNPSSSSLYAKIKNISVPSTVSTDISQIPELWDQLLEYTKYLSETQDNLCIGLIGGETMIQRGAELYIEFLSSLPKSKNISLSFTSNFTTISPKLLQHKNKFARVDITASIDSTGENYHYVRWPAKFSKIQDNLELYYSLKDPDDHLSTVTIATVFSLNNIFYINEYIDFLQDIVKKDPSLILHILLLNNHPSLLVENLPVRYRNELFLVLKQAMENPLMATHNLVPLRLFVENTIKFITSDDPGVNKFHQFLKETAEFDARTKCHLEQFNSRLHNILSDEDRTIYQNYLLYYSQLVC
jgi:hypothetical protein